IAWAVLSVLLLVVGMRVWYSFRSQPQLPASDELFQTVDALFTAVTAKDERRLTDCEQRLKRSAESGELPAAAWKRLERVIASSRSGQWDTAAQHLYDFMQGQRRT